MENVIDRGPRGGLIVSKECMVCGTTFKQRTPTHTTCSRTCKNQALRKLTDKICDICGNTYRPTTSSQKHCSMECAVFNRTRKQKIECLQCHKEFTIMNYMKNKTKFCSRKCSSEYPRVKKLRPWMFCEKICKNCGNKFTTHRYRAKTAVYCSKDCYTSHGNMELKCGGCGINYTAEKNLYDNGFSVRFFCKNCREKNTISAFELDVRQTLIENGFTIETNRVIKKPLGGYIYPDIIISNTVIECNGDFFHCNPEIYDENFKNPKTGLTAKQIWERDKFKNDTYVAAGYNTITLWESKWRDDKEYRQNLVDILRKYEV